MLLPHSANCNTCLYSFVLINKCASCYMKTPPAQAAEEDKYEWDAVTKCR